MKQNSKAPVRVAITGAAGQIGYQLAFRIASGQLFGPDQPVVLQLLEITPALGALNGVAMELDDCAFETLDGIVVSDKAEVAFKDIHYGLLVGARPRGPGMERKDLLLANAQIFSAQGKALASVASRNVKILVVGNPANTNALIARENAKGLDPRNFTAMMRLDHNRARAQLAAKAGAKLVDVHGVTIWGNHSATQYPDFYNAKIRGRAANEVIADEAWLKGDFITTVQQRGAAIIKARGLSSAASAANAVIDTVRSLTTDTPKDNWHSVALCSTGEYGVEKNLIASFPTRVKNGKVEVVTGVAVNEFSRGKIDASVNELKEEKSLVGDLL